MFIYSIDGDLVNLDRTSAVFLKQVFLNDSKPYYLYAHAGNDLNIFLCEMPNIKAGKIVTQRIKNMIAEDKEKVIDINQVIEELEKENNEFRNLINGFQ